MISCNSEILFLYDARLCNPNGDPDEENRPRMDYETGRNLVSDVRLKRYLRDYWLTFSNEEWEKWGYSEPQDVWVRRETQDGQVKTVTAKDRIENLAQKYASGQKAKDLTKDPKFREFLKKHLLDLRFFGATIPIGGKSGGGGDSLTFTGPVQFTWGYSLNRVDILPSSTITSTFAGRDTGEKAQHGTMGKDWRVKYSFIAFWGVVSAFRAKETGMSDIDLNLLDKSIFSALPLMATSRSKIGQTPRLYLRIEYKDNHTFLGDFREGLKLEKEEGLESIEDVVMDFSSCVEKLSKVKDKINQIACCLHPDFPSGKDFIDALESKLGSEYLKKIE
ncbi:MAG: type I-B CRISPR-associated protein Cas7/Csh2 [Desulfonauticus sp.]|nr:type I-B CRISPR-associated protein Cas7/Csh2 [Desulfonauticus sp.]